MSEALQARAEVSRAPEAWEEVSRAHEAWEGVSRAPEAWEEVSRTPDPEDREEMSVGGRGRCSPGPEILNKMTRSSLPPCRLVCTFNHTWTELMRIPVNIQHHLHDFL